jgi:hypothetical protein
MMLDDKEELNDETAASILLQIGYSLPCSLLDWNWM